MQEIDPKKKPSNASSEVIRKTNASTKNGMMFNEGGKTYSSGAPIVAIDDVTTGDGKRGRRVYTQLKGTSGFDHDKHSYFVSKEEDHILSKSPQYAKFRAKK